MFLLTAGTEFQKAQETLRSRFLKDSISKRKLWPGAPKLPKFNRKFGIVQGAPLLSEVDYTSCYETVDQFSSVIQDLSMKSMLNKITQRESRVFIIKGPPGCGKTEVISGLGSYWARHFALRDFYLVLYFNIWDLNRGCTLWDLIDGQFKGTTVSAEKVCDWIQEEEGNGIMFVLDGCCHQYLNHSPLQEGDTLYKILSGHKHYSKSTVVIATTCSGFIKSLCPNYIQFDILGLCDQQIEMQVIQQFDSEKAVDFLSYLAENPEIRALLSSPGFLVGTVYIFGHLSYNNLPVTWAQLYTSLVVLVNEWHKGDLNKDLTTNSLQSKFKYILLKNSRKVIEDSGDLFEKIGSSLIHDADEFDHILPDHNSAVPYLQYFLFFLDAFLNPDFTKLEEALKNEESYAYFSYFLDGLQVETDCFNKVPLKRYYKDDLLKVTKCVSESEYMTAEQQTHLLFLNSEVSSKVLTTKDICSILHCLPFTRDPDTVGFSKCYLGAQSGRQLSRFLAIDSWSTDHIGIRHLR